MKLRVEVTAEDIAEGERQEACACPIALAMLRLGARAPLVAGSSRWSEDHTAWSVTFDDERGSEVELPKECAQFAAAFDAECPVEPFTFEIEVPDTAVSK